MIAFRDLYRDNLRNRAIIRARTLLKRIFARLDDWLADRMEYEADEPSEPYLMRYTYVAPDGTETPISTEAVVPKDILTPMLTPPVYIKDRVRGFEP